MLFRLVSDVKDCDIIVEPEIVVNQLKNLDEDAFLNFCNFLTHEYYSYQPDPDDTDSKKHIVQDRGLYVDNEIRSELDILHEQKLLNIINYAR